MLNKVQALWADETDDQMVIGYMCKTDFEYEIGGAAGGTKVYASVEDLKKHRPCAESCGIVEVEVRYLRTIQEAKD